MSDEDTELNTIGLDALLKALKNPPVAKIGILGSSTRTVPEGGKIAPNNASIGAVHEFGGVNTPQRSFLRMPLSTQLGKELEAAGLFDETKVRQMIATRSALSIVETLAAVGVRIVLKAFDTSGFGGWKPSSPKTLRRSNAGMTLVDTQQLRDSIISVVEVKPGD